MSSPVSDCLNKGLGEWGKHPTMQGKHRLQNPAFPAVVTTSMTSGLWNFHKHSEKKKKRQENAYLLRGRDVNFTNELPPRFCSEEIGALDFSVVAAQGQKTNKLPGLEKWIEKKPIRKHNSSLMEIPEAEK